MKYFISFDKVKLFQINDRPQIRREDCEAHKTNNNHCHQHKLPGDTKYNHGGQKRQITHRAAKRQGTYGLY